MSEREWLEGGSEREWLEGNRLCGCASRCGDDGDTDGPGTCKGLPQPPRAPLVEIVLVPRAGGS